MKCIFSIGPYYQKKNKKKKKREEKTEVHFVK